MTVSTRMISSSSIQSSNSSFLTNGNHHSPDHEKSFDSALDSQIQDDPINKYARILFEHTRRQMDNATHSIRTESEQQSPIPRGSHARAHNPGRGQTSVV